MFRAALLASVSAMIGGAAAAQTAPQVSEVVVTAAPYAVSMDSATTSVEILKRDELDLAPASGLGDVLNGIPGVRSTFFGPGASRPVIRGLAGPRVLVLTNGVGMIDASALSPDHQVASDPQEASRIEVLRGPSALAYGGSAIGGIVNIIDERIAERTIQGVEGRVLGSMSSVDDGKSVSAAVKAGLGSFVVTLDGLHREAEDYDVPVPAESRRQLEADGEEYPGPVDSTVENTAVELDAFGAGLSYVGARGFVGVAVKHTETRYGVPGHEHHDEHEGEEEEHEEEEADDGVAIELDQTRYDLRGGLDVDLGPFERLRFSGGYADYEHVELEGGEAATRFLSEGYEGRFELVQPERNGWQGAVGVQGLTRSLDAIGEEAYVPATDISEVGIFTLQRLDRDRWGIEGGLRLDRREVESAAVSRDFTNVSASLGGFLRPAAGWFFGVSASRTARGPTEAELFANGAHAATRGYEVGDADLEAEVSYSLDATAHYGAGRWEADLHLFGVKYDGFIDLRPTGAIDEDSELPIFAYQQTNANFWGGEADVSYRVWEEGGDSLVFQGLADYVHGDTDLGPPARIPPWSVTGRAVATFGKTTWTLEARRVGAQDRLAEFELPTEAYTMLNASVVYRPAEGVKLFLDGRNLNDTEAREHASFLKDLAPLPGRSLRVGVGYSF